jgi:hypothetical protein
VNSELVRSVSFQDCVTELVDSGSLSAKEAFEAWKRRPLRHPEYTEVIALVEGLTHNFLYTISEEMLDETKASSEHALGDLRKEAVEDQRIENFATPFALHHLFHFFMEQSTQLPTWQTWWKWLTLGTARDITSRAYSRRLAGQRCPNSREHTCAMPSGGVWASSTILLSGRSSS